MNEKARQVLAFIFKRSGKETLPASDVYLAISMELQWCSPKEAKEFVKQAIAADLLKQQTKGVTPSFQVDSIEIPTGFSPPKECFKNVINSPEDSKNDDALSLVRKRVKNETSLSNEDITQRIDELAKEKMIFTEVAAVFFAKKMGCKTQDLLKKIDKEIFKSEKSTT